jgi:ABC-2 type transport system permease protein
VTSLATPLGERGTHRSWRIWRIGPLNERAYRVRLVFVPAMLAIQLFLYYRLWTAVYQHATSAGGLDVQQAVTYSLMALLAARIRWSARNWSMDSVSTRVREGTIIYWFVRPISPARYYMWRQAGDMAYGATWAIAGYLVLLGTGVIVGPGSISRGAVFAISLLLGQIVLYYLGQLVDLSTFWILSNNGIARMYYFIQDLLSGVFVPLWFMPGWLLAASIWLPFNAGINVPLSLYVGRIAPKHAGEQLALQAFWILLLAAVTRWLWTRAAHRVTSMGG